MIFLATHSTAFFEQQESNVARVGTDSKVKSGNRALKSIVDCFEVQPMYGTIGVG